MTKVQYVSSLRMLSAIIEKAADTTEGMNVPDSFELSRDRINQNLVDACKSVGAGADEIIYFVEVLEDLDDYAQRYREVLGL